MSNSNPQQQFRPVNSMLGSQPKFGPFPAEQFIPWVIISLTIYVVTQQLFHLGLTWSVMLIFWGCATWWLLTGSNPWRYLSRFVKTPTWTRGRVRYRSLLQYICDRNAPPASKAKKSKSKSAKPLRSPR